MDLVLLAFLLPLPLLLPVSAAFTPDDAFYLNCGSTSNTTITTDVPSRVFVPDSNYLAGSTVSLSQPSTTSSSPLYSTARLFTGSATYRFPINSQGTHVLRLHFLPFSAQGHDLSAARFRVTALQRFVLLDNFAAPASATPLIKEYFLWVDSGELELSFVSSSSPPLAFVNAVEVFAAPSNLIKDSGQNLDIGHLTHQALETVYRINVGGLTVTPHNDTLWRTWSPDDAYLVDINSSLKNNTDTDHIKYDNMVTAEVAPLFVYSTARTMNIPNSLRLGTPDFDFNVTWSFQVVTGYKYLIRTHFCDFVSPALTTALMFRLNVGNLQYLDVRSTDHVDSLSEPFILDFDEAPNSGWINISVGRSVKADQWQNGFLNGVEIFKVNNTFGSLNGTSDLALNSSNSKDHKLPVVAVVAIVVGGVLFASLLISVLVFVRKRRRSKPLPLLPKETWSPFRETPRGNSADRSSKSADGLVPTASPRLNLGLHIPLIDLKSATNNFEDSLVVGSGGFGKVYKGFLPDGTKVAVKRAMPGSKQGYPEFQTEILVLSTIRHRHLVSLVGYCEEQSERILVYEYMEKGPLRIYLYGSDKPCLSWKQRLEICIGAARGLHYLHTGHSHTIIHRDIKSTNILLDENCLAKVADFGLSKLGPVGETHVTTGVKGTFGYFDPEYFKTQKLTDKSDVYSFGVMLFEVLCARPVIDKSLSMEQLNLAEWALHWQRRGQLEKIIDQRLVGKINRNSLRKFGETAEKCVAEYGIDRPTFADVLWNLEYALQLHVTELKREPHEDSDIVESQIPVAATRREVDSTSLNVAVGEDDRSRMSTAPLDSTGSTVFSQLVTSEGR